MRLHSHTQKQAVRAHTKHTDKHTHTDTWREESRTDYPTYLYLSFTILTIINFHLQTIDDVQTRHDQWEQHLRWLEEQ